MFLQLILSTLTFIITLLPPVNSDVITSISGVSSTLKTSLLSINYLFPVNILFQVLSWVITLYLIKIGFKIIRWLANFIPFINSN